MIKSTLKKSLLAALTVTIAVIPVTALMAQNTNNSTRCNQVVTGASQVGSGPVTYRYRQASQANQAMQATQYSKASKYRQIASPQARRNIRVLPSAWRSAPPVRQIAPRPAPQPVRLATPRPAPRPVSMAPRQPVEMGPSSGAIGTPIRLRINQNFGATPAILSFKAVVSRGVPARVHARLSGRGSNFSIPAPIQLCIQGGGTWQAELVLSNGRNLGVVGSFTPTNCPR